MSETGAIFVRYIIIYRGLFAFILVPLKAFPLFYFCSNVDQEVTVTWNATWGILLNAWNSLKPQNV